MRDNTIGEGRERGHRDRPSINALAPLKYGKIQHGKRTKRPQKRVVSDPCAHYAKGLRYGSRQGNCWLGHPYTIKEPCLGCVPEKHPCSAPWRW